MIYVAILSTKSSTSMFWKGMAHEDVADIIDGDKDEDR